MLKLRKLRQCFHLLEGGEVSQTVEEQRHLRIYALQIYGKGKLFQLFPFADGYSSQWIPTSDYNAILATAKILRVPSPELLREPKPVIKYRGTEFGDGAVLATLVPVEMSMALVYEIPKK
ncbi:MAG TPA: hypothetical protein VI933_05090 [archaeon]|nr:hypothetical protein [archaeon]